MCSGLTVNELRSFLLTYAIGRGFRVTKTGLRKFDKYQLNGARWAAIHGNIPKILRGFPKKPQGCLPLPYEQGAPLPPDRENYRPRPPRRPKPIPGQRELSLVDSTEKW